MTWRRYDNSRFFPRSQPRTARGGIKAQSQRGAFGESWWARRWIAVLEGFHVGARLGRGRSYARSGQVLSIAINKGAVTAKVQGSRAQPYDVAIQVKALSPADWDDLARALSQQAVFAAKLLAGEMPQDIEKAFTEVGRSLFPEKRKDLETHCSCPDIANPCKHIAAVYYLLGEEFDRDPFLIFTLRGMSRAELVGRLTRPGRREDDAAGSESADPHAAGQAMSAGTAEEAAPLAEPLGSDLSRFWDGDKLPDDLFGEVHIPTLPAALPRRLGNFPFWQGAERLVDALDPIYRAASPRGLELFLGERSARENGK